MSVNLSTNTDELIVIINEKLLAIGSEVRVDEWFSIARSVLSCAHGKENLTLSCVWFIADSGSSLR